MCLCSVDPVNIHTLSDDHSRGDDGVIQGHETTQGLKRYMNGKRRFMY